MKENAQPSLDQLSDNLLSYLRAELNDQNIGYDTPPTQILGGYEAFTYRFNLSSVQPKLAGPLILRLFQAYRGPNQAVRERAVQNALSAQGFPAPYVWFAGTDKAHLGGAFLIMDFMPGEMMLAAAEEDIASMLGRAQAGLHEISPAPLITALRAEGFTDRQFRLSGRLGGLTSKVESLPWLEESVQWLIANCPPEPEQLAVCHGDFHPLNILVNAGKVTAVLDWPGFMIGDPAMDIAFTIVLTNTVARHILPTRKWAEFLDGYLEAYRNERPLDPTGLDYYRMLRCIMAFVEGAEGQKVWTAPAVLTSLTDRVNEISQIRVVLPD